MTSSVNSIISPEFNRKKNLKKFMLLKILKEEVKALHSLQLALAISFYNVLIQNAK